MTRTTKTTKTRKAEAKEPSRKPETSREAMLSLFREHVEAKVRAAEQSHNKARSNFLGRFNDPAWGANDAIGWVGGAVIVAEFNYRAWAYWAPRLLAADSPDAIRENLEAWAANLLEKLFEVSRGNRSTSTFYNAVDGFIAEAASSLMRYDLDILNGYVKAFAKTWDTAPATDQDAWDALSVTEKVEYLTWKTDTGRAYTAIEEAWSVRPS
jgi:hypothetical protein